MAVIIPVCFVLLPDICNNFWDFVVVGGIVVLVSVEEVFVVIAHESVFGDVVD